MIRRILVLGGIITAFLVGWNRGFDKGYVTAMADVVLNITTPEKFFEEYFRTNNEKLQKNNRNPRQSD